MLDGLYERTREFYGNDCVIGISSDKAYRELIYEKQEVLPVAADLASLVTVPIEFDDVLFAVTKVMGVDSAVIVEKQSGRRSENAPRRLAIYCAKRLGGFSQRELAVRFHLSHAGSVSSAVRRVEPDVERGEFRREKEGIKKTFGNCKTDLTPRLTH